MNGTNYPNDQIHTMSSLMPLDGENMRAFEREFAASGGFFLPWVGNRYSGGLRGRRLLILGESHYRWEDDSRKITEPLTPSLTRECVIGAIERGAQTIDFWKYIEQAFLNVERTEMDANGADFWNSVAFYNFVQRDVGAGPRIPPAVEDFRLAQKPFRLVLQKLMPERIFVCGKRLWGRMEETPLELRTIHDDVQGYYCDSVNVAWCFASVHPSSGRFSWRRIHPILTSFLDSPSLAAKLLSEDASE